MDKQAIDYYAILGVDPKAGKHEIDQAYKSLAKRKHPDKLSRIKKSVDDDPDLADTVEGFIRDTEEEFKLINAAYLVLTDKRKRKAFDKIWQANFALPKIVISQTLINFGRLKKDQDKTANFVIENEGGPVSEIAIDWVESIDWVEFLIEEDPLNGFPIKVTLKTIGQKTQGIKEGMLVVKVNGLDYLVDVRAEFAKSEKTFSKKIDDFRRRLATFFNKLDLVEITVSCLFMLAGLIVLGGCGYLIYEDTVINSRDLKLLSESGPAVSFLRKRSATGVEAGEDCLGEHAYGWCEEAIYGVYEIRSLLGNRPLSVWWAGETEFENCTDLIDPYGYGYSVGEWTLEAGTSLTVYCLEEVKSEKFLTSPPCLIAKDAKEYYDITQTICAKSASDTG